MEKKIKYFIRKNTVVIPHQAFHVMARKDGLPCGEYRGYYDDGTGLVTLYPDKGSWIYGTLVKHSVPCTMILREGI